MATSQRGQETFARHQHLLFSPSASFTPYLQLRGMPPKGKQGEKEGFSWQKVGWELGSLQRKETRTLVRGLVLHSARSDTEKCSSRPGSYLKEVIPHFGHDYVYCPKVFLEHT